MYTSWRAQPAYRSAMESTTKRVRSKCRNAVKFQLKLADLEEEEEQQQEQVAAAAGPEAAEEEAQAEAAAAAPFGALPDRILDGSIGERLLQYGLGGFNCTVFAYGQTGAGKSYSVVRGCTVRATGARMAAKFVLKTLGRDDPATMRSLYREVRDC